MLTFDKFDTVFYTLAFIVPGFLLQTTIRALVPRQVEEKEISFLRYFAFSCINYALWSWLIYLMGRLHVFTLHPVVTASAWFLIVFASPLLLGLIAARQSDKETVRKALQKLGLHPIHDIPTCWDYKFSKTRQAAWVIVTLKDGSLVRGYYGPNSFSSSDASERDLYLEEVYTAVGAEPWKSVPRSDGILIKADQIKLIEFKKN